MGQLIQGINMRARKALMVCTMVAAGIASTAAIAGEHPPDIERVRAEPTQVRVQGDTVAGRRVGRWVT